MENQSSLESHCISQSCIYCIQKDQIIKKYQKLVQLLKKKARRCSSYTINSRTSSGLSQQAKQIKQIGQKYLKQRNSEFLPTISQKSDNQCSTLSPDVEQKYKIKDQKELIGIKEQVFESTNKAVHSAPAGFYRSQAADQWKKITLSTLWLKKFNQLSKKLNQKQNRVNTLIDKIFSLKNEFLYIRSIFIQLIKSLRLKANQITTQYKLTIDSHSRGIINLLMNLFQYSEQEMNEIFGIGQNLIQKSIKRRQKQKRKSPYHYNNFTIQKQNIRTIR